MKPTTAATSDLTKKSEFKIGDMVAYKPGNRMVLRCGSGTYDEAVVISEEPFVLCSKSGDMIWSATVTPEDFVKTGEALFIHIKKIRARLKSDESYGPAHLSGFEAVFPPPPEPDKIPYNSPERMIPVPANLLEKLSHAAFTLDWEKETDAARALLFEGYTKEDAPETPPVRVAESPSVPADPYGKRDYDRGDKYRVGPEGLTLGYDSHVRAPTPSRYKTHPEGTILAYSSSAPNGNVWFYDPDFERGKIEAGEIGNLTKDGRLTAVTPPTHGD
jgi:hypothetical protein